ncbi:Oxalate decarboxylase OxdC [Metarhizium anisopliae]|nr:Oxalate decarboxylase OxdC [Metarhizium anisopliae]
MKLTSAHLLLTGAVELCGALPHYDSPQQRLAKGLSLTGKYAKDNPYTPDYSDPHDHAIDAIGKGLDPRPWRNGNGATVLGPYNRDRSRQSPDMIRPPSTDHGNIPNMRWSYTDSHVRIEEGGWTRQTTVRELPTSIELAGVNMRLDTGVIRELHWHKEAEWAYVLEGEVRVTALDYEGGNFMEDLKKGDLWYFPSGVPHSLQGLAHTPKSVIAKNFRLDPQVFAHLPAGEKYIFQGSQPGAIDQERPSGKHVKKSRYQFTHRMLDQEPKQTSGGLVRITDSTNFPIAQTVAAAHVIIEPGALREMHWHPTADEWSFFIRGRARVTVFAAEGNARTFDYVPGDVGIVPKNMGHFVENIGDEPVEMLEVFRADKFRDFSLFQWMGETPRRMVVDHLFAGDEDNGRKFWDAVRDAEKDEVKQPGDVDDDAEGE